jgi:ABC-type nitrate/sulfonate/bicarbonate transport system substrate-binding protein
MSAQPDDLADAELRQLWYTRCPVPTPLGLAAQLGWFNEEFAADGIQISTLQETEDATVRESHYDHHLHNSFRQGGNVPPIWARAKGRETRVIGLNWVDEYQGILTLPGSGIQTPADLRGRRVALPRHHNSIDHSRASALRGVVVTLQLAGIDPKEVEFIDADYSDSPRAPAFTGGQRAAYGKEVEALVEKRVDAIFVKGSRGIEVTEQLKAHVVFDVRNHPDPRVRANNGAPRPVTVDLHLLQTRPDIVTRFLKRIVDVGAWAVAHPGETVAYVARETGSREADVRRAYGADLHLRQVTDLAESSIVALEGYKNFLLQWGFLAQDFDVRNWIDPRPLAALTK